MASSHIQRQRRRCRVAAIPPNHRSIPTRRRPVQWVFQRITLDRVATPSQYVLQIQETLISNVNISKLQHHLYADLGPHRDHLQANQRTPRDFFLPEDLRQTLQRKTEATLTTFPSTFKPWDETVLQGRLN